MPLTPAEFAQKIKGKYPGYAGIPDDELVKKILAKYPEYEKEIDRSPPKTAAPPEPSWYDAEIPLSPIPGVGPQASITARGATEAIPGALATGLGVVGGLMGGPPGAGLGAMFGGFTGEQGKRAIQARTGMPMESKMPVEQLFQSDTLGSVPTPPEKILGNVEAGLLQGGTQALMEGPAALGRLAKAAKPLVTSKIAKLAEALGLPPSVSGVEEFLAKNTMLGKAAGEKGGRKGVEKALGAVEGEASALNLAKPPEVPGLGGQSTADAAADVRDYISGVKKAKTAEDTAAESALKETQKAAEAARTARIKADKLSADSQRTRDLRQTTDAFAAEKAAVAAEKAAALAAAKAQKATADASAAQALEAAKQGVERDLRAGLGPELMPTVEGGLVHEAVGRGVSIAERDFGKRYGEVEKALRGVPTSTERWKAEFTQVLGMTHPLTPSPINALAREYGIVRVGEKLSEEATARSLPDEIPWTEARKIQKQLGQYLTQSLSGDVDEGAIRHLWKRLTQEMEIAAEVSGQDAAQATFRKINADYHTFADAAKRSYVPKAVKKVAETFVQDIPLDEPTNAKAIKSLVLDYAEKYGDETEKAAAQEAMKTLGDSFVRRKLLAGGYEKLGRNLALGDPARELAVRETVETLLPAGSYTRLKGLAKALDEAEAAAAAVEAGAQKTLGVEAQRVTGRAAVKDKSISQRATATKRAIEDTRPPAPPPEVPEATFTPGGAANVENLGMLDKVLKRSLASKKPGGGIAGHWSFTAGTAITAAGGAVMGHPEAIAIPLVSEVLGGLIALATYDPALSKRLTLALRGFAQGVPGPLMRMIQSGMKTAPPQPSFAGPPPSPSPSPGAQM